MVVIQTQDKLSRLYTSTKLSGIVKVNRAASDHKLLIAHIGQGQMSNTIRTEKIDQSFYRLLYSKERYKLGTYSLLFLVILSACQARSTSQVQDAQQGTPAKLSSVQEQAQDQTEKGCKKIGDRCRLKPGVLGVCSPSSPQSEALAPWAPVSSAKRLYCTPQH